ncbi:GM19516 [Drosophila sechellia]|uniref:GM19516 n=1 Tax=Drosophila sechellia TaxID=7238 RepID=B4I6Z9_DROSE|nr:GM19516 [Drosophila sechellia]
MSENMENTPVPGMYEVSQKYEENAIAPMFKAEMFENMENTPVTGMDAVFENYQEKAILPMFKAIMSEDMEFTPLTGMYEVSQKSEEKVISPMFKAEMSENMENTPVTGMDAVSEKYERNAFAPMSEICAKDYTVCPMDGIAQEENTFVSIPDGITRLKDILDTQTIYVQGNETVAPINEMSQMINTVSPLVEISQNEQNINGRTENGNPKILMDTSTISMNDTPTGNPVGTTNVVVMVEEPNTIIELLDYYVPPASLNNNNTTIRPFFPITVPMHPESSHEPTPKPPTKGKRGRKPGPKPKPRATKRRRPPTPPPLPPVPNFLAHVINPLENEIYPKVIVQPAHLPWVLPSHCNDGVPNPPPSKVAVKEVPNTTTTSRRVLISAHLREKLRLFGPDVIISVIDNAVSPYFKAVKKEPDGSQHQIFFTAPQLLSFTAAHFGNWAADGAHPDADDEAYAGHAVPLLSWTHGTSSGQEMAYRSAASQSAAIIALQDAHRKAAAGHQSFSKAQCNIFTSWQAPSIQAFCSSSSPCSACSSSS